jgi:hypothetical protein
MGDTDYTRLYKDGERKRKARIHQALLLVNSVAVLVMVITVLNMIISAIGWT